MRNILLILSMPVLAASLFACNKNTESPQMSITGTWRYEYSKDTVKASPEAMPMLVKALLDQEYGSMAGDVFVFDEGGRGSLNGTELSYVYYDYNKVLRYTVDNESEERQRTAIVRGDTLVIYENATQRMSNEFEYYEGANIGIVVINHIYGKR